MKDQATMSIGAIIFWTLLINSVANASIESNNVEIIEPRNVLVPEPISEIQRIIKDRDEISGILSSEAAASSLAIMNDISRHKDKVIAEMKNRIDEAKYVDVSRCMKYFENLNKTALSIIMRKSQCVADKLQTGLDKVVAMDNFFKTEMTRLHVFKADPTFRCAFSFHQIVNYKNSWCIEKKIVDERSISSNFLTEFAAKRNILRNFLETKFVPSIDECTGSGRNDFLRKSEIIFTDTNTCIQEQISNRGTNSV